MSNKNNPFYYCDECKKKNFHTSVTPESRDGKVVFAHKCGFCQTENLLDSSNQKIK